MLDELIAENALKLVKQKESTITSLKEENKELKEALLLSVQEKCEKYHI